MGMLIDFVKWFLYYQTTNFASQSREQDLEIKIIKVDKLLKLSLKLEV